MPIRMSQDEFEALYGSQIRSRSREAAYRVLVLGEGAYRVAKDLKLSTSNVLDSVKRVEAKHSKSGT